MKDPAISHKTVKIYKNALIPAGIIFLIVVSICINSSPVFAVQGSDKQNKPDIKNAIIKIYTVKNKPFYFNPWMTFPANNENGSGCIINGNRILTNAHVVANQTFIQVRKYGESRRYNAKVLNISHEADLALLSVYDKSFFSGVEPLDIGGLPETRQEVFIYGFPEGDSLRIAKGILSWIGHQTYKHSSNYFLAGQIVTSVKPGSSGGPVIADSKLVGVLMQAHVSENTAYMVPSPIIKHFLEDIDDGHYDGFPDIGLVTETMQNPDIKRKYKMLKDQTGVLVNHVHLGSPVSSMIMKDDILLAINGHLIGDNGTVEIRPNEHTSYTYYVEMLQLGDSVNVDILRDGKIKNFTLILNTTQKDFMLVPREQYDQKPRYFIYGGIVFSPLTKNFINEWQEAPEELIVELSNWPTEERREVVVILQVLPSEVNIGYQDITGWIVSEVNGKKCKDFNYFVKSVTNSTGAFITFKNTKNFQIVIDRRKALDSHAHILQNYNIKEDRSPDFKSPYLANYLSTR